LNDGLGEKTRWLWGWQKSNVSGKEQPPTNTQLTSRLFLPQLAQSNSCVLSLKEPPITVSKQPLSTSQKSHPLALKVPPTY